LTELLEKSDVFWFTLQTCEPTIYTETSFYRVLQRTFNILNRLRHGDGDGQTNRQTDRQSDIIVAY